MSFLSLDIGNSALKGAIFRGEAIVHSFRIPHASITDETFAVALSAELDAWSGPRAGLCSVVPTIEHQVETQLIARDVPAHVVSHRDRLPIRIGYDDPALLGTDRVAAASAAYAMFTSSRAQGAPIIVVDVGSAATFNVIHQDGLFAGGLIWAGPNLVSRALHQGTAQLPATDTDSFERLIATDTAEAIATAARIGFVEGARGILGRLAKALGATPQVVITGGGGALLHDALDLPHTWEPHLVLHGVRLIADMNQN